MVDVAIEISLLGGSEPFFIWVWESKNYSSPLSVDQVEEFHSKLQQIGADKTKGTVFLSGEIQKSALAYAAANGIAQLILFRWARGTDLWSSHTFRRLTGHAPWGGSLPSVGRRVARNAGVTGGPATFSCVRPQGHRPEVTQ